LSATPIAPTLGAMPGGPLPPLPQLPFFQGFLQAAREATQGGASFWKQVQKMGGPQLVGDRKSLAYFTKYPAWVGKELWEGEQCE
jgi:hypothetical protein